MARRQPDPEQLNGEELRQWYQRPSADIERQQRTAADERYRRYFSEAGVNGGSGPRSPVDIAEDAFRDFQNGPKIQRPNLVESFIPVVGPAWEAAADLQDGNYGGAAFNGAMAVADLLPVGALVKGGKAASKGIGILKKGSVTAGAAAKKIRRAGLAGAGEEIHHSVPLNGLSRSAQDWRNHYAFLKVLPRETHRRLTGRWASAPRFTQLERMWHGTTDWQKSVPTALAAYAADTWENLERPFDGDVQRRR